MVVRNSLLLSVGDDTQVATIADYSVHAMAPGGDDEDEDDDDEDDDYDNDDDDEDDEEAIMRGLDSGDGDRFGY